MAEYISREDVIKKIAEVQDKATTGIEDVAYYRAIKIIRGMPPADIHSMKQGRWISQGNYMWLCSNCKENIIYSEHESDRTEKQRYCCKCGARMDLKEG